MNNIVNNAFHVLLTIHQNLLHVIFERGASALGENMHNRSPTTDGLLVTIGPPQSAQGATTEPAAVRFVPVDDDSSTLVTALMHSASDVSTPGQPAVSTHTEMLDAASIPVAPVVPDDLAAGLTVGIASSIGTVALSAMSTALRAARKAGATTIAIFLLPPFFDARPTVAEIGQFANAVLLLPADSAPITVQQVVAAYACTCEGNVDVPVGAEFLDLREAFEKTDGAFLGIGFASGHERARRAAEIAISTIPKGCLEASMGLAIMVAGNRSLRLQEVAEAAFAVHNASAGDASGALAAHYDDRLKDRLRVTVIAAYGMPNERHA